MFRLLLLFVTFLRSSLVFAWDCNTYDINPGTEVSGCLPSLTDIQRWEAYNSRIAALEAASGGTPGTTTFPDLFNLTAAQGAELGGAIMAVFAVAWIFRILRKQLEES